MHPSQASKNPLPIQLTPSGTQICEGGKVQNISNNPLAPCYMFWSFNEPLPEPGQIRPTLSVALQHPPILNTGNRGPIEHQPGDWICKKCNYLNWRRRKVCQTCYPCMASSLHMTIWRLLTYVAPLSLQTLKETAIQSLQRSRQNESHYWPIQFEGASSTPFLHPRLPRFTSDHFAEPLCRSKRSQPPSNRAATFAVTMANTRYRCLDHAPTRLIGS